MSPIFVDNAWELKAENFIPRTTSPTYALSPKIIFNFPLSIVDNKFKDTLVEFCIENFASSLLTALLPRFEILLDSFCAFFFVFFRVRRRCSFLLFCSTVLKQESIVRGVCFSSAYCRLFVDLLSLTHSFLLLLLLLLFVKDVLHSIIFGARDDERNGKTKEGD